MLKPVPLPRFQLPMCSAQAASATLRVAAKAGGSDYFVGEEVEYLSSTYREWTVSPVRLKLHK